jgi:RNA recognition motif-containing protein
MRNQNQRPNQANQTPVKNPVVYIGNLNYKRDEFGVMKLFKPFGYVEKVNLIKDEKTGNSKGIAFVEMQTKKAANEAVQKLNGTVIDGRTAKVSIALERDGIQVNKAPKPAPRSKKEEKAMIKKSKVKREGLDLLFKNTNNL